MRATTRRSSTALAATAAAGALVVAQGVPAHADEEVSEPHEFTSMYTVEADPDMVVDDEDQPVPGEEGAWGTFDFRINSDEEVICYDIEFEGVTPPYESPARTATHIHEASADAFGPPRLAFPDPEDDGDGVLRSSGCMQGPFTTGVEDDEGNDTGEGFTLAQIEEDPESFYADTHTADFPDGAIRGQLWEVPMGGMETGGGGAADLFPSFLPGASR
ncbi:CHRD domain-containing protein [Nocardiopsis coralli]|uniref:CHRD domain-containing protein n=1 Tax=Nocardiopsis coralli TaxID=2772213 RepID=UPI001F3CB043|nr:CHRD domain-containing protein [Nocardiopsis coralli]